MHRLYQLAALVFLATAGVAVAKEHKIPAHAHFATVLPGKALPTDVQCAAWVQADARAEVRPDNARYNLTRGKHLPLPFFFGSDARANTQIAARVSGQFVGTTEEILRWGACKWGLDEDVVKALAVQYSGWQQARRAGEVHLNAVVEAAERYKNPAPAFESVNCQNNTMPGSVTPPRALPADAKASACSRDWGVMQVNYEQHPGAWPQAEASTAMNVDVALAEIRACYQGYEKWLSSKPVTAGGKPYAKGDLWGCVGRYKSGLWHDAEAESYIAEVKLQLQNRSWEVPAFADANWVYP